MILHSVFIRRFYQKRKRNWRSLADQLDTYCMASVLFSPFIIADRFVGMGGYLNYELGISFPLFIMGPATLAMIYALSLMFSPYRYGRKFIPKMRKAYLKVRNVQRRHVIYYIVFCFSFLILSILIFSFT